MIPSRTRGAVLLSTLGLRQEDIARRAGVRRAAVGHWMTGHRRPLDNHRLILRDVWGIPIEAWVEAPDALAAAPAECYAP